MSRILLNIDIGEQGCNHAGDLALIQYTDIANIACGGHAGSAESVDRFKALAEQNNIMLTAHVAYPDKANFGRATVHMPFSQLRESLGAQLAMLPDVTALKFHGALYNDCCSDEKLAQQIGEWLASTKISCVITLKGSALDRECQRCGIQVLAEAFAERRYAYSQSTQRLSLLSRKQPNACITDVNEALQQVRTIVQNQQVEAIITNSAGQPEVRMISLDAETICIHSDSSIALELAKGVAALLGKGMGTAKRD